MKIITNVSGIQTYEIILNMIMTNIVFLDSRKYDIWDINTSNIKAINNMIEIGDDDLIIIL